MTVCLLNTHFFSNFISLRIGGPGIWPPFPTTPALQLSYKWYSDNHNALCHTYITTTSNYCKQLMDGEINTDLFSLVGKRKNVCLSEERTQLYGCSHMNLFFGTGFQRAWYYYYIFKGVYSAWLCAEFRNNDIVAIVTLMHFKFRWHRNILARGTFLQLFV